MMLLRQERQEQILLYRCLVETLGPGGKVYVKEAASTNIICQKLKITPFTENTTCFRVGYLLEVLIVLYICRH